MADPNLVQELLDNYVYQKEKLVEEAGGRGLYNMRRAAELQRHRIEEMAGVVADWNVQPRVIMAAVFEWAKYNRHPDGPMPNMLKSAKYIARALSHYLQVPFEVVMEKRSGELFLRRMDDEYERMKRQLRDAGVTELSSAASFPIEFRYVMAVSRMDLDEAFDMAQETLEQMSSDGRVMAWMDHRGASYERVAGFFNRRKKQIERQWRER